MNIKLSSFLYVAVFAVGSAFSDISVVAQVTTDGTTSTTVTPTDTGVQIDSGDRNGGNLFHSFDEFSVPTNSEAFFNNANDVANIFSRVTGGNLSNIDGTLRANGAANLFLINPAGIVFGNNARLQLGGSFYGSTADSIIFPDGEFNATDLENPPLITVNAPIGLGFRDRPGEIVNQSTTDDLGLQITSGNTFALVGGDVRLTGGFVSSPGADIELGGLTEMGIVTINEDGSLSFSDDLARANVILDDASVVNVISDGGGSITVNAQNLELLNGSILSAGILEGTPLIEAQAGDIIVNVRDKITLDSRDTDLETSIQNVAGNVSDELATDLFTKGSPGNISINTKIFEGNGNFSIVSANNGEGNVGNVNITATESISLRGQAEFFPGFGSAVGFSGIGDGGDVIVTTPSLTIFDANILSSTLGKGNAGNIIINVADFLTIDGESQLQAISIGGGDAGNIIIDGENANISLTGEDVIITTFVISSETQFALFPEFVELLESLGFSSTLGSQGGDIAIGARNLTADDNVRIVTSTAGQASTEQLANAGNIDIKVAENISFSNSSVLSSNTVGQGNAGNISLSAGDAISFSDSSGINTGIEVKIGSLAEDFERSLQGGDINLTARSLSLSNASLINASTLDRGNAGTISIATQDSISLDSGTPDPNGILSVVGAGAVGNGGEIKIATKDLFVNGSGGISANTLGQGNSGSISITAAGNILLDGATFENSGIFNVVNFEAIGDGGEIKIATTNLTVRNGATIDASTSGLGNGGAISIAARDISIDGTTPNATGVSAIGSIVDFNAVGNGGEVMITTNTLSITGGAFISTSTAGQGDVGKISIDANESIVIDGQTSDGELLTGISNDIFISAVGNSNNITIVTDDISLSNQGFISTSTQGEGNGGQIDIAANRLNIDGAGLFAINQPSQTTTNESRVGGNINLEVRDNITLRNNSFITAQAGENASGGNINIDTDFMVAFPSRFDGSDIRADAQQGKGGNINITAESVLGIAERTLNPLTNDINASSQVAGLAGTISIDTPDINALRTKSELPNNPLSTSIIAANACNVSTTTKTSNLIVRGKSGLIPSIINPLTTDNLIIDEQAITLKPLQSITANRIPTESESAIAKAESRKFYAARGLIRQEDGTIYLTAYPTSTTTRAIANNSEDCGYN